MKVNFQTHLGTENKLVEQVAKDVFSVPIAKAIGRNRKCGHCWDF